MTARFSLNETENRCGSNAAQRAALLEDRACNSSRADQLPQYELQDPAWLVVLDLVRRIDPGHGLEGDLPAGLAPGPDGNRHSRLDAGGDAVDIERLEAGQPQSGRSLAFFELQRED